MAWASFIAYLVLVVGIGVWSARYSSRGLSEFFLAGRRLPRFVVALSAVVSGRSAWLIVGMTGMAYKSGVGAVWALVGYIVVELFLFRFYAGRLRRFTGRMDDLTLPDFFESRFKDRTGVLRGATVLVIVVFMAVYVSAQFVAGGKALDASFEVDREAGIVLTALIVLIYTVLGGFLAVSLTDVVQAFFMLLGLVVVPLVAILDYGGMKAVIDAVAETGLTRVDPWALGFGATVGLVGIGLGSPGNPHILVRYMSIDDPRELRATAVIGTVWNVIMGWGALYAGLAGRALFRTVEDIPGRDTEHINPALAKAHLHPILYGFVLAAIFAAIMSTCDSQLLVAASAVVRDIYQKVFRRRDRPDPKMLVWLSRAAVLVLVAASLLLGFVADKVVFWLVLFAWAGLGAAFGPTTILALFWRRTTGWGVLAGMLAGTAVVFVWQLTPSLEPLIYELVPAFGIGLLVTIVVSLLTRPPDGVDEQFRVMSGED
ncbi:MAG: sodium/proline symporter [Planctomycetota bacterium]|jgi:SSS family solute:Na+ symporter